MFSRRWIVCVLMGLATAGSSTAQTVNLTETAAADRCFRNELTMEFAGKITVKQEGKDIVYPHKADARHEFMERFLDVSDNVGERAARFYSTAERAIRFNNDESMTTKLRPARRFLAAVRVKDLAISFSPSGRLTRDEADLTEHFDTLAIPGLVPGKEIEVGKSWKVANKVVGALCGLDGLAANNLEGTLDGVKGNIAHAKLVGTVSGIDKGAQVSILVNGRLEYDLNDKIVTFVEWKQTETREQGPISPKIDADLVIRLKRQAIAEPNDLGDNAIVPIPKGKNIPAEFTNIDHTDARKRYALQYSRDWHVTSTDDNPLLVMRLMERGEFIAQVTVSPWKRIDPKNVMSLEQFADAMAGSPGWTETKEHECKQLMDIPKNQHTVYRRVASGELEGGVKTWQYFYLVVGQQGDHCMVTFSVEPKHVAGLGVRDRELVRELVLPTAGK